MARKRGHELPRPLPLLSIVVLERDSHLNDWTQQNTIEQQRDAQPLDIAPPPPPVDFGVSPNTSFMGGAVGNLPGYNEEPQIVDRQAYWLGERQKQLDAQQQALRQAEQLRQHFEAINAEGIKTALRRQSAEENFAAGLPPPSGGFGPVGRGTGINPQLPQSGPYEGLAPLTPQQEVEQGVRAPGDPGIIGDLLTNPIGLAAKSIQRGIEALPTGPLYQGSWDTPSIGETIDKQPGILPEVGHFATGTIPFAAAVPFGGEGGVLEAALPALIEQQIAQGTAETSGQYSAGLISGKQALTGIGVNIGQVLLPALIRFGIDTVPKAQEWLQSGEGAAAMSQIIDMRPNANGVYEPVGLKPDWQSRLTNFFSSERGSLRLGAGGDRIPEPPPISKLPKELSAEEEAASTRANIPGGVMRSIGEATARLDNIISSDVESRATPVKNFNAWLTHEANRFGSVSANAVALYQRDVKSADAWGAQAGDVMGARMDHAFPGGPNATYRSPVTKQAITVGGNKLTNADVVESWGHVIDYMSPQQVRAARLNARDVTTYTNEARKDGVRIGNAQTPFGGNVHSFVPRTMTSVAGPNGRIYAGDLQASSKPGAKISIENAREHVTRSEGQANGVKYAGSWKEEYTTFMGALRKRQAAVALKTRLDQVSETATQRLARTRPDIIQHLEDAKAAKTQANAALRTATTDARRTAITKATREVHMAERAVDRAQRALSEASTARKIEGNRPSRAVLSNQVGRARERLVAATNDLRNATTGSLEALSGARSNVDVQRVANAKANVEASVQGQKDAQAAYRAAMKSIKNIGPREVMSPGGHPITQGRIFPVEEAGPLQDLAKIDGSHGLIDALNTVSLPARFALAILDDSYILNQAWNFALISPPRWTKTFIQTFFTAASPGLREAFINAHQKGVQLVMKYAPEAWDQNPDFAPRGNVFARQGGKAEGLPVVGAVAKIGASPFRYTDRLFKDGRTLSAVYLMELWAREGMSEEELYSVGSAVTKITGVSRSSGPESALAFAGRYTRAQIAQVIDGLSSGGPQGAIARNIWTRQILAATVVTILAGVLAKKSKDQIAESLNPSAAGSFQVGGFSLFGANKPLITLLAKAGDSVYWDVKEHTLKPTEKWLTGPLLNNYLRSKANPIIGKALNALIGENAIGQPTNARNEFANYRTYLPIAAQATIRDVQQGANPLVAGAAELSGARYQQPSAFTQLQNKLNDYGIDVSQYFGERATRDQANSDHADLQQAYDDWRSSRETGSTDQRTAEKIVSDHEDRIKAIGDQVRAGNIAPTQIKDIIKGINDESRIIRNALTPDSATHNSRLDPLYAIYDDPQYQGPDGKPNFDQVNAAIESYLKDHEDLRKPWQDNQFVPLTNDPVEKVVKDGQRTVAQDYALGKKTFSYYGVADEEWRKLATGKLSKYATSDQYRNVIFAAAIRAHVDPADMIANDPILKVFDDRVHAYRVALLEKTPTLGAYLSLLYGVNLPTKDLPSETNLAIAAEEERIYKELGIRTGVGSPTP